MRAERGDITVSYQALAVFFTMRSNLAMLEAFLRRAGLEESNYDGNDLGFLGIKPGEKQRNTHNRSVTTIAEALLYQLLENYLELKRIKPALEDTDLEDYLEGLESQGKFINGMRLIRNGVFHVNVYKPQDQQNITSFYEICNQCGGVINVIKELRELFYSFTKKLFSDKLQIWPADHYENRGRLYAQWKKRNKSSLDKLGDNP